MSLHPIQQFNAPSSIQTGTPLADLFNVDTIALIGQSFAGVCRSFDPQSFTLTAVALSAGLPLKAKTQAIAIALRQHLPVDDHAALDRLRAALGPPLTRTVDNGLQPMFYMPHSALLSTFGGSDDDTLFEAGLQANFELTTRFTAEFSIRPFLTARLAQTMSGLTERLSDPNPHIRRLISEGSRPRLPWASHLKAIRADPSLTLPLLTTLRDDPDRYVTRSVANHLGDIGKDHLDVLLDTTESWLTTDPERRWLIRHALRHPAKKGHARALAIRVMAAR
jgi:3-methyladenine DNA glycosylase AlkC